MKEWKCVLVGHHNNVGKVIEEWERRVGVCTLMLVLAMQLLPWARIITCYLKKGNKAKHLNI